MSRPIKVDLTNRRLLGYVVLTAGVLKDGRGEFTEDGLRKLVDLGNANPLGIRSRFNHAPLLGGIFTEDGGLGSHLGRAYKFGMSTAKMRDGRTVAAVRADLQLDPTAMEIPPHGGRPLGEYLLHLALSDPDALSSSIVAVMHKQYRLHPNGTRILDVNGDELPPVFTPATFASTDFVVEGAGVDSVLAAEPTGRDAIAYRQRRLASRQVRDRIADIDAEIRDRFGASLDAEADAEIELRVRRNRARSRSVLA